MDLYWFLSFINSSKTFSQFSNGKLNDVLHKEEFVKNEILNKQILLNKNIKGKVIVRKYLLLLSSFFVYVLQIECRVISGKINYKNSIMWK